MISIVPNHVAGHTLIELKFKNVLKVDDIHDKLFRLSTCVPHRSVPQSQTRHRIQIHFFGIFFFLFCLLGAIFNFFLFFSSSSEHNCEIFIDMWAQLWNLGCSTPSTINGRIGIFVFETQHALVGQPSSTKRWVVQPNKIISSHSVKNRKSV